MTTTGKTKKKATAPKPIRLVPVAKSTAAFATGYDPANKTLAVQYKQGGDIYHYPNFTASDFAKLEKAESLGTHLSKHVRQLPFIKLPFKPKAAKNPKK